MLPLSEKELDELVARERERGAPPLTDWDSLSAKLEAEGLIREPIVTRFAYRRWIQVAAGLAIAVGGAAIGRATADVSPAAVSPANIAAGGPAAAQPGSLVSRSGATQFASPEEAWDVLNRAGDEYQRASAYLSASNTAVPMPPSPDQYRTRLAALDNVMSDMRVALKEAPQDPVINQYYLATVGAREATLSQLKSTLPARASLNRF